VQSVTSCSTRAPKLRVAPVPNAALSRGALNEKLRHFRSRALPPSLKKAVQRAVLADCAHQCAYCATGLSLETLTLDHVEPLALGGSNQTSNLVACCGQCNNFKDSLSAVEFFDEYPQSAATFLIVARGVAAVHRRNAEIAARGPYGDVAPATPVWRPGTTVAA
jgi:5-methylcytosine-specific restriction endonuclease McrA